MATSRGGSGSQSSLRRANTERLLDVVRQFGSLTQVELAQATGLSPATVSTIVKDLQANGAVETRQTIRSGRRAQLVTLAHRAGLLVGAVVGERSLRIVIADSGFDVLARQELLLPAEHRHDTTLDRAALLVADLVDSLGSTLEEVLGIGVAVPAPIDPATGAIPTTGILRGWEDLPIAEVLGRRLGAPAVVGNDADLGALGELRFGAGRGHTDLLYVRASYGVGGGIILGGRVHHGHLGTAGEIGHMLVDSQGAICRCGSRGCLNTVCGAQALIDSLRHSRGPVTLTDVLDLAIDGDPGCQRVLYDAGTAIGTVAAHTALALNPELIIVGGELARAGALLLDPMRDAIRQRVPLLQPVPLDLVPAELGDDAETSGALALAAQYARITTGEGNP